MKLPATLVFEKMFLMNFKLRKFLVGEFELAESKKATLFCKFYHYSRLNWLMQIFFMKHNKN